MLGLILIQKSITGSHYVSLTIDLGQVTKLNWVLVRPDICAASLEFSRPGALLLISPLRGEREKRKVRDASYRSGTVTLPAGLA